MRYSAPRDADVMRRASLGPAALVERLNRFARINAGIPQRRFIDGDMMRQGGSFGHQLMGNRQEPLGCLCGPGDPGFGALAVPAVVKIGPIAARMIAKRKAGATPQAALLDALNQLHLQGATTVTPEIHLQLAAGLQPAAASGLSGYQIDNPTFYAQAPSPYMGALGLAPVVGAGVTSGSIAASSVGVGAATALGIGSGIALGQTMIPIPVVGAVIGAIIFEAAHLLKRHIGKAEAAWANQGFYNSLRVMNGRDYDEKQFSESFKGMMDTGNNIVPGCGPDRHKNPDCLLGPLSAVIAQAYLTGAVPLSATTSQVFRTAVIPWLQSGAGGLVNWANLSREPIQQLMLQAATDRYLAGQAMTRGDMPSYGNAGAHTPTLVQALQPILRQPVTSTPMVPGVTPPNLPGTQQTQLQNYPSPSSPGGINLQDPNSYPQGGGGAYPPPAPYTGAQSSGGGGIYSIPSQGSGPAVGYPTGSGPLPSPFPQNVTAGGITGLPTWATLGLTVISAGFLLPRIIKGKES